MPRPNATRFEAPPRQPVQKKGPRKTFKKKILKKAKPVEHKLLVLSGKQRTYLRGLAHDLNPLLQLGKAGITGGLLEELGRALDSHELIKIRLLRECPDDADGATVTIEKKLKANVVAKLGNILVLYRRNPEKQRISLPNDKKKAPKAAVLAVPDDFDDDDDDDDNDGSVDEEAEEDE